MYSGLDETVTIHDKKFPIPLRKAVQASVLNIPLFPLIQYGHSSSSTFGKSSVPSARARDYFYCHLSPSFSWASSLCHIAQSKYWHTDAPEFIERLRRHYFPPSMISLLGARTTMAFSCRPSADRLGSGQPSAHVILSGLKELLRLGHAQVNESSWGYTAFALILDSSSLSFPCSARQFLRMDANNEMALLQGSGRRAAAREDYR